MSKLDSYKGSIEVTSGLKAKNGNDFPILEAHSIQFGEGDQRLDDKILEMSDDLKTKMRVSGHSLMIDVGKSTGYHYEKTVNDRNYIEALFSVETVDNVFYLLTFN